MVAAFGGKLQVNENTGVANILKSSIQNYVMIKKSGNKCYDNNRNYTMKSCTCSNYHKIILLPPNIGTAPAGIFLPLLVVRCLEYSGLAAI